MAEIKSAGDVNDINVAKHIAGKFDVNKSVASDAAQNSKYGSAPLLFWAAYGGHEKAIAALLKAGAKKDCKAKTNETPLQIAVRKERSDACIKLLGGVPKPKPAVAAATKPAAVAAKPAAAPVKPVVAAAAAKPAVAPVKPVVAAAKPAAAPVKPAATPVKPSATPVKPAAAPLKTAPAAAKPGAAPIKPLPGKKA